MRLKQRRTKVTEMMNKKNDQQSAKRPRTTNSTQAVGTTNNNANDNDSDDEFIATAIGVIGKKQARKLLALAVERKMQFDRLVQEKYDDCVTDRRSNPCNFYKVRESHRVNKLVIAGYDSRLMDAVYAKLDQDNFIHKCKSCERKYNLPGW